MLVAVALNFVGCAVALGVSMGLTQEAIITATNTIRAARKKKT